MVYDYNEIIQASSENNEKNISMTNEIDIGNLKEMISNYTNENTSNLNTSQIDTGMKRKWNSNSVLKICQMKEKYCNFTESSKTSSNHLACLFFKRIILKNDTCYDIWFETTSTAINSTHSDLDRETNSSLNFENYVQNNVSDDKNKKLNKHLVEFHNSSTSSKNAPLQNTNSSNKNKPNKTLEILSTNVKPSQQNSYNLEKIENSTSSKGNRNISHVNNKVSENIKEEKGAHFDKHCDCSKDANVAEMKQNGSSSEISQFEYVEQDVIDSATQMQKESILVKLTMRIKESEINLNLINKYLQQLSESYKRQIQDMLSMFSGTVKAIRMTSEKGAAIVSIHLLYHILYVCNACCKQGDSLPDRQTCRVCRGTQTRQSRKCHSCKSWDTEAEKMNRNTSISITPLCGLRRDLIVCSPAQFNSVSKSMFGQAFLLTTSLDRALFAITGQKVRSNLKTGQKVGYILSSFNKSCPNFLSQTHVPPSLRRSMWYQHDGASPTLWNSHP
ncbi:uncharacterized protein TNCV_1247961 [Trichonephila clavipes]|nr:uncharacterized protein TNCV_1247961 [Trichonephila clavipes]